MLLTAAKYQILDTIRSFSKNHKPISQLDVLGEEGGAQMLVSLSDCVNVHELPSFTPVASLAKTKLANLYCLSPAAEPGSAEYIATGAGRTLAVAVKRKLVMYRWEGAGELEEANELTLPDMVRSAVFADESICLGYKKDYTLVHSRTGMVTELFPVGREGNPMAVVLPTREILLTQDNVGIFIGFDGSPTRRYGLTWAEAPTLLALSYPYVLGANARQLDARCMAAPSTPQSCQLRGVQCLAVQPTGPGGAGGAAFVASAGSGGKSQLHLLRPTPPLEQVELLVGAGVFAEALALCEQLTALPAGAVPEGLAAAERAVQERYGRSLFAAGDCSPGRVCH